MGGERGRGRLTALLDGLGVSLSRLEGRLALGSNCLRVRLTGEAGKAAAVGFLGKIGLDRTTPKIYAGLDGNGD